jgi:hypothetical protein
MRSVTLLQSKRHVAGYRDAAASCVLAYGDLADAAEIARPGQ